MPAPTECDRCREEHAGVMADVRRRGLACFDALGSRTKLPRGKVLYSEGDVGTAAYFLLAGVLKACRSAGPYEEAIVEIIEPGRHFGLEAIVGAPFRSTVRVVRPAEVCRIEVATLQSHIAEHPGFGMTMLKALTERLLGAENHMAELITRAARSRVAAVLLDRMEPADPRDSRSGMRVRRDLSRQELAAFSGMRPETFIRALSEFRRKKIISSQGRVIYVLDPERLASIAGRTVDAT